MTAHTKAKAGCWTGWSAFAQVRQGSNIQLLPFLLVISPVLRRWQRLPVRSASPGPVAAWWCRVAARWKRRACAEAVRPFSPVGWWSCMVTPPFPRLCVRTVGVRRPAERQVLDPIFGALGPYSLCNRWLRWRGRADVGSARQFVQLGLVDRHDILLVADVTTGSG